MRMRKRKVRFELTNSGVGHAFPTYAVPTVVMSVPLEPSGSPRPLTLRSHVIARRVHHDGNAWVELSNRACVERKRPHPRLARCHSR
jgi:hypothetical protein